MAAAAHGRGKLDIPKSVGKEFLRADKARSSVRRKKPARHIVRRRTT